ncbi:MAG: molybdopterin-dependent oxidoreductase [Rhodospirillales bacterium]|nr:molybdopterin-dependent oxidoreductase [Rhodospirillales bacterium]
MKNTALKGLLLALPLILKSAAGKYPSVKEKIRQGGNRVVQIGLKNGSVVRHLVFGAGGIASKPGRHPSPDVTIIFKDAATALAMMKPGADRSVIIDAAKNFKVVVKGKDKWISWFMQLMGLVETAPWKYGMPSPDGTIRYTTNSNGGPLFVYVRNGKILRVTPITLEDDDAASWSIQARGRKFTPLRKATVSPHALSIKSSVYSEKRLLYPMKRVDFDPNGERNTQNRGKSGYVRISWDEALDIVAGEISRMKTQYGPGAITIFHPAHHQWGNIGYWLSALLRFGNFIGFTRMGFSPVSWEGWYWGAAHHFGNSLRLGLPGFYGTVEDCLKEAEQIVFWSSDPESTGGLYAAFEATQRRMWAKELGIDFIHIDPHLNNTAQFFGGKWIPIRPGTDPALAIAIMHEWIVNGLYDKKYVAERTNGFEEWRDYVLGVNDGIPKTPEWQEAETGVPAKDVRSLATQWGSKKTYLAAGGLGAGWGGACRSATGSQWARCMILMMAMQGWGKPGVNFGNLQFAAPLDHHFYFPGYTEGGISGELTWSASSINNYCRMPHVLTMNPVKQVLPRQRLPEAILDGKCTWHAWDGSSLEAQFAPVEYPMKGYSPIHMLYRYGSSSLGTMPHSARLIEAYRHPSLEFIVNQSIFMEGEAQFADVILPACTFLERWDIGEWANCGGFLQHNQDQLNHRIFVLQHKCIEPLGESKSDYQIFMDVLERLGTGFMFSEGCSELAWCKRIFDSSDLPKKISWKEFLKKGYYVLPPEEETARDPVDMRWFAEGRSKDVPEMNPLPAGYAEEFGKGLQTQSGKIEFVSKTLARAEPDNPERPALNRYIPQWEGPNIKEIASRFPLQLLSAHPSFTFHTYGDEEDSFLSGIQDHRIEVGGFHYRVIRVSPDDAKTRGIGQHDLVRVFNDRGAVLFAADVSPLIAPGVTKAYTSCAQFDLVSTPKGPVDRGGCINLLTPGRTLEKGTEGIAPNSCMVELEKWEPALMEAAQ